MYKRITIISVLAMAISACSSSNELTGRYDDIYYSPQDDIPKVSTSKSSPSKEVQALDGGSTLQGNHVSSKSSTTGTYAYDMTNMQLVSSDTTMLSDDNEATYVVNNFYGGDDISYSDRINRFYRGYYDPFWYDDYYYSPYYWGMAYDPWYYGGGFGWGIGFGWGMAWNWGYGSWGYPGWGGYYPGWGGGYYPGGGYYHGGNNVTYAPRRSSYGISSRYNNVGGNAGQYSSRSSRAAVGSTSRTNTSRTSVATNQRATTTSSRTATTNRATILDTRNSSNRVGVSTTRSGASTINATSGINRSGLERGTSNRVQSSGTARTYTPSYTQSKTVNRANYNNSSRNTYNRSSSQGSNYRSSVTTKAEYNRAPANTNMNRATPTYRTNSSPSYNRSTPTYRPTSTPSRSVGGSFGGAGGGNFGGGMRSGGGRR